MRSVRSAIAAVLTLALVGAAIGAEESFPGNQKKEVLEKATVRQVKLRYLLFLPKGYDAAGAKRWPLILFLHGAGERGSDLAKVAIHGPPKVVASRPDFPFIVVSPQLPAEQGHWVDEDLLALLDEVEAKYAVDRDRVYLTGLSMGGYGTWSLGLTHPERFAAIAPFCGGGSLIPILLPENPAALKTLPVWAFHGGKDGVVKPEESERLVSALKRLGNEARLTILPEAGHDCWTGPYGGTELYDWFLRNDRKSRDLGGKKD